MNNRQTIVCAIIGDVVSSRGALQQPLFETLAEVASWINLEIKPVHEMKLAPAAGDEIQGACSSIEEALKCTLLIQLKIRGEYQMRFGLGYGTTDSLVGGTPTVGRSGTAWWNARDAINALADLKGRRKGLPESAIWTRLAVGEGGDRRAQALTNGLLLFRDQIVESMNRREAQVTLELFRGKRQVDISRKLGVSQSSVSDVSRKKGGALLIRCQEMLDAVVTEAAKGTSR
jgi:hypothetical protein